MKMIIRRLVPLTLVSTLIILTGCFYNKTVPTNITSVTKKTVVIDPGHGGEDGGTVAADGTLEKDINLAVALDCADLLRVFGFTVEMTRQTDMSLGDASLKTVRERKTDDLMKRAERYRRADICISIHQNYFSQEKYSGTQVFYSPNHPAGKALADAIQSSVKTYLQPDNKRETKVGKGIYLLDHAEKPTVLVECGFLSNLAERERLKSEEYQKQLSCALLQGLTEYLGK